MKHLYYVFLVLLFAIISACSKEDSSNQYEQFLDNSISSVALYNAIPGSQGLNNVRLDMEDINVFNGRFGFGEYSTYRNILSGNKVLKFSNLKEDGTENYTGNVALVGRKVHSVFLIRDKGLETLISQDDMILPREGKLKVRFVHLCPDASDVMVSLAGKEFFVKSLNFKSIGTFQEIDFISDLELRVSLKAGEQINLTSSIKSKKQGIYTILLKGFAQSDKTNEKVNLQIIEH